MKKRKLRDLEVSAIGYGCMGLSHAYGEATDLKEATNIIDKAIEIGYTFFDTAEVYGTADNDHHNEELLGKILKPYRKEIVIATKFGLKFDKTDGKYPYPLIPDSRPETIRQSIEGSLKRLQTDHIDLYYQHRQDPEVPVEEVAGVMADLIQEGKILAWGLSEVEADTIKRAHSVTPLSAIENRYSMMARWYGDLFPLLEELGIGFVAFSPLANGFLSGKYDQNSNFDKTSDYRAYMPQFQAQNYDKNRELLALLNRLAKDKNATPAQISLAWMLAKEPWIVPIPGTRNITRLEENSGAAEVYLSEDEEKEIDTILDEIPMSDVFGQNFK
ncbi:MAG: aldo/keto reductase [Muribaculaceae bacterium]|nr:aldo/keto reductase [Muribaculaceae bacterium]